MLRRMRTLPCPHLDRASQPCDIASASHPSLVLLSDLEVIGNGSAVCSSALVSSRQYTWSPVQMTTIEPPPCARLGAVTGPCVKSLHPCIHWAWRGEDEAQASFPWFFRGAQ